MTAEPPNGIALVDKAPEWTSHDVVAKARGKLGTKKVGHAGTLDPDATGLLILGVGRSTRLLTFMSGLDKTYVGEAVLGVATSTLDASGDETGRWDMTAVTREQIVGATAGLTGTILQVPPMVSAKKVAGKRLHELARQGIEVERQPVEVRVESFAVGEAVDAGVYLIEVSCSSGTYIRSLVADLGTALGGGAHLRNLRRLSIGRFDVADAVPIDKLGPEHVLAPLEAFRGTEPVVAEGEVAVAVRHGQVLPAERFGTFGSTARPVVDADGTLLAVYVPHRSGTVKPAVVLA